MNTDKPDHHESHRRLIWVPDSTSSENLPIDAVIVPTIRHPGYLFAAAKLAVLLGCPLVTLHSGERTTAALAKQQLPGKVDLIAIDVPRGVRLGIPQWDTSRLLMSTAFAPSSDLSLKRNIGLQLSRMLDWTRIFFLDDDIIGLEPGDIKRASGMLDVYNAVGLRIGGFPDHSVVCHAYRDAGGKQQGFVGGGALVVHALRSASFFPEIYNDDWFYLLDENKKLQPVATTGEVKQQPYDPFRTPNRARAEELGDVLAEGLYWLLDQGGSVEDADREHWLVFLARREQFIKRVMNMVNNSSLELRERNRRISALDGSLQSLRLISPELCLKYLHAWDIDRALWHRHIISVPTGLTRRQALNWLSREGNP